MKDGDLCISVKMAKEQVQHDIFEALRSGSIDAGLHFGTVENQMFKKMIIICNHDLQLPFPTTASRNLIKMYKSFEIKEKDSLKDIPGDMATSIMLGLPRCITETCWTLLQSTPSKWESTYLLAATTDTYWTDKMLIVFYEQIQSRFFDM